MQIPVGPLFCVIDGRTRGRPLTTTDVRQQLRRAAVKAGVRRRFAPHQLRVASAAGSRALVRRWTRSGLPERVSGYHAVIDDFGGLRRVVLMRGDRATRRRVVSLHQCD